jgi:hypothetical protein
MGERPRHADFTRPHNDRPGAGGWSWKWDSRTTVTVAQSIGMSWGLEETSGALDKARGAGIKSESCSGKGPARLLGRG